MMLIVAALVLLFVGVGILSAGLVMRRRARANVENRLKLVADVKRTPYSPSEPSRGLLKVQTKEIDKQARRIFAIGIERTWAMRTSTLTLLLTAAASAIAVWILAHSLFRVSTLMAIALSLGAAFLVPRFVLSRQQKRAERKFTELFPEAVDTVARMVRAGLPITAALRSVAVESSPPVSDVFAAIADQLKIGVPTEIILDESSTRIGLPDYRFFTVAIGLQYATGGNLTQTLEILSDIIRKRRAMRLKAKAATGEIRITAYTLGGLPIVTIGALLVLQPKYLVPLWADPRGHFVIAMAGVFLLLALVSMRWMVRSASDI
jgi:tight adherence protein B